MSVAIPVASPLIPGHEFGGTIAITGGSVSELRAGDQSYRESRALLPVMQVLHVRDDAILHVQSGLRT